VLGILFAILWGMIAIDLAMTMDPALLQHDVPGRLLLGRVPGRRGGDRDRRDAAAARMGLTDFITARQYHDLGKLVFAFSVFWMYLNWSQYIVIWYGMLPWEQPYSCTGSRSRSARSRRRCDPGVRAPLLRPADAAAEEGAGDPRVLRRLVLIGHWLERFLITCRRSGRARLPLGLPEIGIGLGFLGCSSRLPLVREDLPDAAVAGERSRRGRTGGGHRAGTGSRNGSSTTYRSVRPL
jgi:hypothetical protein